MYRFTYYMPCGRKQKIDSRHHSCDLNLGRDVINRQTEYRIQNNTHRSTIISEKQRNRLLRMHFIFSATLAMVEPRASPASPRSRTTRATPAATKSSADRRSHAKSTSAALPGATRPPAAELVAPSGRHGSTVSRNTATTLSPGDVFDCSRWACMTGDCRRTSL